MVWPSSISLYLRYSGLQRKYPGAISMRGLEREPPRKHPENTQKTPGKIGEAIVNAIRENPYITRKELEELLSRTPDSIKYHLSRLTEQGFVKREGPDRGGRWIVLKEY